MPAEEGLIRARKGLSAEALALKERDEEEDEEEMDPLQKARAILRNNYMVFVAADEDRSMSFGYHEFRGMLPTWLQRKYGDRVVRSWFDAMDRDEGGGRASKVSLHEYFLFSVTSACQIAGCTQAALFAESDQDGSDELNEAEFKEAVTTMGFGRIATTLFYKFDRDRSGTITVGELFNTNAMSTSDREALKSFVEATRDTPLGTGRALLKPEEIPPWGESVASPAELRQGLIDLVVGAEDAAADPPREPPIDPDRLEGVSGPRTLELFRHIDPMGDGLISADEFYHGMVTLGYQGPSSVVMELFQTLDGEDGNDTIEYDQFSAWLLRTISEAEFKARAYRSWKITETEEEAVRVQLSKLMKRDGFNATDLFAAWEKDTDGKLRKHIWLVGMKKLVNDEDLWRSHLREVCDNIFATFKTDSQGKCSIYHFTRWLSHGDDRVLKKKAQQERPLSRPSLELRDKLRKQPMPSSSMLWRQV